MQDSQKKTKTDHGSSSGMTGYIHVNQTNIPSSSSAMPDQQNQPMIRSTHDLIQSHHPEADPDPMSSDMNTEHLQIDAQGHPVEHGQDEIQHSFIN